MFKRGRVKKEYKGFFEKHTLLMASATLMGTVIGAGILGIPYAIAQSGLFLGIINLLVVGFAILILHLCIGEIALRTKGKHQLSGYIDKYLGKTGKYFVMLSMLTGIYGALVAYIIGEGEILSATFGGNAFLYSLGFFLIASAVLYHGIKATGRFELAISFLMILAIFLIGAFAYDKITPSYFTGMDITKIFLPYGVILFAFVGTAAIPELREMLEPEKHKLKKAIIIGSIIPIAVYLLFTIIVLGVVGLNNFNTLGPNERIATIALSMFSGKHLANVANIFAGMAMFTSFLGLGLALMDMFKYDFGIRNFYAFLLTVTPPLIIALSGITSFIVVIGFTGAVAGGVDGILIMLAYWKAKKHGDRKPEYTVTISRMLTSLLILMFSIGIIYQLWVTFA